MGFQVSAGVDVNEIDLSNVIPAVSTSIGGYVGDFTWGPVNKPTLISSENELVDVFGPPTVSNELSYLEAASFLKYGNALQVVRSTRASTPENLALGARNAAGLRSRQDSTATDQFDSDGDGFLDQSRSDYIFNFSADDTQVGAYIENDDAFDALSLPTSVVRPSSGGDGTPVSTAQGFDFAAKFPGTLGNSLGVTYEVAGNPQVTSAPLNGLFSAPGTTSWAESGIGANVNDEIHVCIFDQDGDITGTPGQILETYKGLSLLSDSKTDSGGTNYFLNVINRDSNWLYISNAEYFVNVFDREIASDGTYNYFQPGMASNASDVTNQSFLPDTQLEVRSLTMASGPAKKYPSDPNDSSAQGISQDLDWGVSTDFTSTAWWNNDDGGDIHAAKTYHDNASLMIRSSDGVWRQYIDSALNNGLIANEAIEIADFPDTSTSLNSDAYLVTYVNVNIPKGFGELAGTNLTRMSWSAIQPFLVIEDEDSAGGGALAGEDSQNWIGQKTLDYDDLDWGYSDYRIFPSLPGNHSLSTWFNADLGALAQIHKNSKDGVYALVDGSVSHDGGILKNIQENNYSLMSRSPWQPGTVYGDLLSFSGESLTSASGLGFALRFAKFTRIDLADYNITGTDAAVGNSEILSLAGGANASPSKSNVVTSLDEFSDGETLDVNLLFARQMVDGDTVVPKKIQSICEARKDCVGFVSPPVTSNKVSDVEEFFNTDLNVNSSYLIFDSGPLYAYNKYFDKYNYIQAAGHMAGLCARTDDTNDPWFSPAGYNRGQLLGVTKLKINPNQAQRDSLYKKRINPIVSFPGQGILLFGDKTAQSKPSAFDRINVRRLFMVLEKAIATAAKFQLFELNDEFTRAMFRNMVEPFLRDVKGRRGVTDFLVVCDETNNTGQVIDTNRFVADIYIKPSRSINFITLNFIATRTGVEFSEIAGGQS